MSRPTAAPTPVAKARHVDVADRLAAAVDEPAVRLGAAIWRRVSVTACAAPLPAARTLSVTCVPSAPLMRAAAASADSPATATPSTATIQSPAARPAALAGEPLKTPVTIELGAALVELGAYPRVAARQRLGERLALRGGEVDRVGVVQRGQRGRDAGALEARRVDRLVVVRLQLFDDERVEAARAGRGAAAAAAGVAAQRVAGHERGKDREHDEDEGEDGEERTHERPW